MVASNAISFLASLVSVNNIQLHFESKRLPGLFNNARRHSRFSPKEIEDLKEINMKQNEEIKELKKEMRA
ncbi:hypothetical protein E2C01_035351 [Portunus trituberculatus]|uniref:Uncharacterized protein n=1 Tax=Portunus trituberculatus TaxID=210409 RepID=A0A5B7F936_PORTR|nr:hypothetical protein [Portunus trituberculatus]